MKTATTLAAMFLIAVIGAGRSRADDTVRAKAEGEPSPPPRVAAPLTDRPQEEGAVRAMLRAYTEAFNAGKADDLAALVTEDAVLEDDDGTSTVSREAIRRHFAESFADGPTDRLEGQLDTLRFFSADVARAEGRFHITPADGEAHHRDGRFSMMAVRRDGLWRAAEIRDLPDPDAPDAVPTPYERLKELEWMVGDWVDETEDAKVSSSVKWADNRSFLVRSFSVEIAGEKASSGTMFLGWDPRAGQIKSWIFDSDGDTGEGYWTQVGPKQWMVKAQGVHHDGQMTSATQLHTIVNKDAVKSTSFDRTVGGEALLDIGEIIMVRKPPRPDAGAGVEGHPAK